MAGKRNRKIRDSMGAGQKSRQNAGVGCIGDGAGSERLCKARSIVSQCIQRGRLRRRIAVAANVVSPQRINRNQDETHGIFLYDSTTHVPLLVKLPLPAALLHSPSRLKLNSYVAGRVVEAQVRTIDIVPTIADWLGMAANTRFDGESFMRALKPLLQAQSIQPRPAIGETDYPLRFGWAGLRSIRANGQKLIEAPRPEYFDLNADPGEMHDLYAQRKESVQALRTKLAELLLNPRKKRRPIYLIQKTRLKNRIFCTGP